MKKYLLLFALTLTMNSLSAQIKLDSIIIQRVPTLIDSVQFIGTSSGQFIDTIAFGPPYNDVCGSIYFSIAFKGCSTSLPIAFDTTVAFGFSTQRILTFVGWDTTANCSLPLQYTIVDTLEWEDCYSASVDGNILKEGEIELYPNPANDIVYLNNSSNSKIKRLYLVDLSGRLVKEFDPDVSNLELIGILGGVYFLNIENQGERIVRKLIVE